MTVVSTRSADAGAAEQPSYAQILRSSALLGGASALNLAVGIVRTKVLAVLLGPAGIGLLGVFTSIIDLTRSVAQLGINASGVRQIAEAVGSQNQHRIARTVVVLRRVAVALGLLGMVWLIVFSHQVSHWAFGNASHSAEVAWLSLAVFFRLVADGQAALFQGMRRIADLAKIGVLGALAGALVSAVLAAAMGKDGIVPGLIATAALSTLISWSYARKVRVEPVAMSVAEVKSEAASLLKLGLAFTASAVLMTGAAFAVRAIVLRTNGAEAAGLYQAAWTLGGMYVGFVLQAMGTDFYPRLVGVIDDPARANRIVNEQAQVSLLLGGPGIVATLVFAEPVLRVFYSEEFASAVEALRWISMGMALRIITWPVGYIIVAKNRQVVFFGVELAWTIVNVGLSFVLVQRFGLDGAAIAFFLSYVFHAFVVYPTARSLTGFRWSGNSAKHAAIFLAVISSTWIGMRMMPAESAIAFGAVVGIVMSVFAVRELAQMMRGDELPNWYRRLRRFHARVCRRNTKDEV